MTQEDYQHLSPSLPNQPGVYQFMDKDEKILYVGKAKNLKKRLASYFGSKKYAVHKTKVLVKNAARFDYTIVENEQDALLLENTLIKKYQPRYNVQLKDGKSYPYICIKKERFPRVFMTRNVIKDGSRYFGPYTSVRRVQIVLDLIRRNFQLRTCSLNLSEENINAGKFKVCLEYHIKNCLGPCEALEDEITYNEKIRLVKNMLSGKFSAVIRHFKNQMEELAADMEFEKAQNLKEKISSLEKYQSRSTVVNANISDVDVFSFTRDEKLAYVNYIKVVDGAVINTFTLELTPNLNEKKRDLLAYGIEVLRERFQSLSTEIIVPFEVTLPVKEELSLTIPKVGDKKKLLELSETNGTYYKLQKKKMELAKIRKQPAAERILKTLQSDLNMEQVPLHIECFDNSNIQGTNPVASMVVFRNASPSKKDYRHYHIKTVEGPDDFASMEEVVYRRYLRLMNEEQSLPQLIVIDGGKGQLSSAVTSLKKLDLYGKIVIVGIAKKLEEIYFPEDSVPLLLSKRSESLKLIQRIRNEAHRFAITFHRDLRSKEFTKTELTEIPGIGEKTAQKLLIHFKSVKMIREAQPSELMEVVGKVAALKVKKWLEESNK